MTRLRDVMTTDVATCTPQDNVYEAAVKMRDLNIGGLPVVDESGRVIGMVTDRDLVIRGIAEKSPNSRAVSTLMTRDVVVGRPDMTVDEAAELMAQRKIRRLPVVDDSGRLVGIVALGDLAVRNIHQDEAAQALQEISEPARPNLDNPPTLAH